MIRNKILPGVAVKAYVPFFKKSKRYHFQRCMGRKMAFPFSEYMKIFWSVVCFNSVDMMNSISCGCTRNDAMHGNTSLLSIFCSIRKIPFCVYENIFFRVFFGIKSIPVFFEKIIMTPAQFKSNGFFPAMYTGRLFSPPGSVKASAISEPLIVHQAQSVSSGFSITFLDATFFCHYDSLFTIELQYIILYCNVIGNAVPPMLAEKIYKGLLT